MKSCTRIAPYLRSFLPLLYFFFFGGVNIHAQYPDMLMPAKTLHAKNGLPDEYITCMVQDSLGYMWIGTRTGLCRYDGTEIKTWLHSDFDATSLSNNWVISLHYNQSHNELWVGTAKGLNFFDLQKEEFRKPNIDTSSNFNLTNQWITGILCDKQKEYWLYNIGLHHYNPTTQKLSLYKNDYNEETNFVTQVIQDKFDDNILWLGTMNGYVEFNKKTKKYQGHYFYSNADENTQNAVNQVELCMYQHDDGRLFGGGLNGGLTIFDQKTGVVSLFMPKWNNFDFGDKIHYKSIIRINENFLCIGTDIGMIWYNPMTDLVLNFFPNSIFSGKTITPYYIDRNNRVWISSSNGLDVYDTYFNQFISYDFDEKIMPDRFITIELLEDNVSNSLIFIQNGGNEVYSFDLKSNTYTMPLRNTEKKINTVDLLFNRDNELLVLSKTDVFKYKNGKFNNLEISPKLKLPPYSSFLEGQQKDLFLLSIYEGMFRLTYPNFKIKHYDKTHFNADAWWLKEAFFDSDDKLWVNHLNIGFSIFDLKKDSVEIVFLDNKNPIKIPRVKDQIWLNDSLLFVCGGIGGIGLIHKDHPKDGVFKKFISGNNGLVTDKVYALEKDKTGRIWMLTDIGVQVYNPLSDDFHFFSYPNTKFSITSDILDQFFLKQLNDGRMVFAYPNGLAFFNPLTLYKNHEQVRPLLSSISVLNEKMDINYFKENKKILAHNENYIAFNFSSIGFTAANKNSFKYKLIGIDKKWTSSSSNQVEYAHLPDGKYTFSLKAANNDLVWSDNIVEISFTIKPPWWKTWRARSLYTIAAVGLFFYWYDNRKKKWKLATEVEVQKERVITLHKQKKLELLNAIISGEEKERARLSRELHDSVGAMISSIKMYFQALVRDNPSLKTDKTFNQTKELISETYTEVRNISHNLMPYDIYKLGLETTLKNLCDKYKESGLFEVNYQFFIEDVIVEQDIQLNLYRIVQEVFKNISIHANAKNIFLQLSIDTESIHLEIENDGDIFDVQRAMEAQGMGLKNISTRVKYIKGELDIVSNEKIGTIFSIYILLSNLKSNF